jgi:hypothetical protein
MMVTVPIVRVVEVSIDQVVHMLSVWYRFVSTVWTVVRLSS